VKDSTFSHKVKELLLYLWDPKGLLEHIRKVKSLLKPAQLSLFSRFAELPYKSEKPFGDNLCAQAYPHVLVSFSALLVEVFKTLLYGIVHHKLFKPR